MRVLRNNKWIFLNAAFILFSMVLSMLMYKIMTLTEDVRNLSNELKKFKEATNIKIGNWQLIDYGDVFELKRGNEIVARFSNGWDKMVVYMNSDGKAPYYYVNHGGQYGLYK